MLVEGRSQNRKLSDPETGALALEESPTKKDRIWEMGEMQGAKLTEQDVALKGSGENKVRVAAKRTSGVCLVGGESPRSMDESL